LTDELPFLDPVVLNGEIPWTLNGLQEVLAHMMELSRTPHDDWDRRKRSMLLEEEDGSVSELRFNPDNIQVQVHSFMRERLREAGEDERTVMSHMMRFMQIQSWLSRNHATLESLDLIRSTDEDLQMSEYLLEELATSRYEAISVHPETGEEEPSFDLVAIAQRVKEREARGSD